MALLGAAASPNHSVWVRVENGTDDAVRRAVTPLSARASLAVVPSRVV